MPDIPAKAVLDQGNHKLFIDGVEFPYMMTNPGPVLSGRPNDLCTVTLTFLVDSIEVLPIPERTEAECQAELHVQVASQKLTQATEGGDPTEIDAAEVRLAIAKDMARANG